MKKKTIILGLGLLALGLSSCGNIDSSNDSSKNTSSSDSTSGDINVDSEPIQDLATQAVLSFQSINLSNNAMMKKRNFTEEEILSLQKLLGQVEIFLNEDKSLEVVELTSDKEEYVYCLQLNFSIFEINETFTLYYNDINSTQEVEKDDDEDENEVETKINFQGLAIYQEGEYQFNFESEEEVEGNESESESVFTLIKDKQNYIKVQQEIETEADENELSYSYQIFQDGKKAYDYKIKSEQEMEDGSLEKQVNLRLNNVDYKIKYFVKDEIDYLKVTMKTSNEEKVTGYFKKVVEVIDEVTYVSYEYIELI